MNAGRARLFVGAALPAEAADELHLCFAASFRRAGWRPVDPRDLHITLLFLGAVAVERIGELERALTDAFAGTRAFEGVLDHPGAFPSADRPRVAWWGGRELSAATHAAHVAAHRAARRCGLHVEIEAEFMRWTAHVTVARPERAEGVALPPEFTSAALRLRVRIDAFTLFEVRPAAGPGERYFARRHFPLIPPPP